jgi:hypothetical protein
VSTIHAVAPNFFACGSAVSKMAFLKSARVMKNDSHSSTTTASVWCQYDATLPGTAAN